MTRTWPYGYHTNLNTCSSSSWMHNGSACTVPDIDYGSPVQGYCNLTARDRFCSYLTWRLAPEATRQSPDDDMWCSVRLDAPKNCTFDCGRVYTSATRRRSGDSNCAWHAVCSRSWPLAHLPQYINNHPHYNRVFLPQVTQPMQFVLVCIAFAYLANRHTGF